MTMVPEIVDLEMPVEGVFHNLVITKIEKSYAGQGQKVMNAMWGAGQMMFNKILVLTSSPENPADDFPLGDYLKLARSVFRNLDPATDIHFSQGPMDVLDHSCSKLGFGGKMCIDGTFKFEEETDDAAMPSAIKPALEQLSTSLASIDAIDRYNIELLKQDIPVIILAVKKENPGAIKQIHQQVCALPGVEPVKLILYVEHTVDPSDITTALWRFCNNL